MPSYLDQSHDSEFTVNVTVTKKANSRKRIRTNGDRSACNLTARTGHESPKLLSTRGNSAPRREWDNVAARVAERASNARSTAKGLSGSHGPGRIEKPQARRHRPSLSIDTNIAQFRQAGKQVPRKQRGSYHRLNEVESRAREKQPRLTSAHHKLSPSEHLPSRFSPLTPIILVTPAVDDGKSSRDRPRAASSIYSRLTSGATPLTNGSEIPQLPLSIPKPVDNARNDLSRRRNNRKIERDSSETAFEEDWGEKHGGRTLSSDTEFEEDTVPLTEQGHSKQRSSTETTITSTPHRSKGWWDVIKTPFASVRSPVLLFGRSPTEEESVPRVPALPPAVYQTQSRPDDGLGADNVPKNTHNSQALRRLESKDNLHVRPMPPMPRRRASPERIHDSPEDREVPLMLHASPTNEIEFAGKASEFASPSHFSASTAVASERSTKDVRPSTETQMTPDSTRSAFSPVGQFVAQGEVKAAKGVVQFPQHTSTNAVTQVGAVDPSNTGSLRSSLIAEVIKTSAESQDPGSEGWWRNLQEPAPYFPPPPFESKKSAHTRQWGTAPIAPSSFPPARFSVWTQKRKNISWSFVKRIFRRKDDGKVMLVNDEKTGNGKKIKKRQRRRRCCFCLLILLLVVLGIVLGVMLSKKKQQSLENTQITWFNVTDYPPIPGGLLTVARPELQKNVSGCVNPQAMWSCAVPKEQQDDIKPNRPDQPNFIFDIRYDNSSATMSKFRRSGSSAVMAWSSGLQRKATPVPQASPKPPSDEEYAFMGNTTDNTSAPTEGEATPFYISFKPPSQARSEKRKREASAFGSSTTISMAQASTASLPSRTSSSRSSATTSANNIPNISTAFPKPAVNFDGTAQAANLLPFPSYQPLRLFNRGLPDEHYGFYTYFSRSIFLRSVSFQNSTQELIGSVPADANGGSTEEAATAVCTWTDTRFKVAIFTNMGTAAALLPAANGTSIPKMGSTVLQRPGSFPYPVTVTLDRHGGGLTTKMLYCYGMDDRTTVVVNARKFQPEDRAFGGTIINPSEAFVDVPVTVAQGGPGGIDGGTGGCLCAWANWRSV